MKATRSLPSISRPSRAPEVRERISDDSEQSRLTIELPKSLHRALKTHCAAQGVTIRDLLIGLMKQAGVHEHK